MLRLLELEIDFSDGRCGNASMGSVFHGAFMERIPRNLADQLHETGIRPYSQCIYHDSKSEKNIWKVGFLNEAVYEAFSKYFREGLEFQLIQQGCTAKIANKRLVKELSYEELADSIFLEEKKISGAGIQYLTTTGFKRGGYYVIMPEPFLLIQSLLMKWNEFTSYSKMEEENLAENLAAHCHLSRYKLQSQIFSVEHRNIQGFGGYQRFGFHGSDMVLRLLGVLFSFALFAGIGIKTALGMGGVKTELYKKE